MFSSYDYFKSIIADVPAIKAIYRISGIAQLEEALSSLRNLETPCLLVNDAGDGYLDLNDRRFMAGYYNIYVFDKARTNDSTSRVQAKNNSRDIGIALFDRMMIDAQEYEDPAYGFDASRIDYSEIGPIASGCYGYSFGFNIHNEF